MSSAASHLMTDWICIATEGETVDGREIPASWLTEMAETYDPAGTYTALIWPEHERYWGSAGEVLELKAEKSDTGLTKLYARLSPSPNLIYSNRNNQLLFASIEPVENFRNSGKTYLKGLGVTNQPASIGTDRMRFNAKQRNTIYGTPVPFVIDMVTERPGDKQMSDEKKPLWMSLFGVKPQESEKPVVKTPENKDKSGEEFTEALQGMAQSLSDLQGKYNAVEQSLQKYSELEKMVTELKKQFGEITQELGSEQAKELFKSLPDLLPKFKKLDQAFTQLPDKNPGEKEQTTTPTIC
ncbi:GPO family capsid scaffolding protein [Klebsiella quasipneumoniae]|uniref:GPO family capsid scaffolding protein n=1 Tax=Klebsiella quasipneumoniae TaxID=1463165 RepID=UPI00210CF29C|nr:GPO family capsid scaffolding protein [Klebsiella quasipneumoniae]MCQ3894251.1 GPO family capsid scaffolding protein [Klebsiella quasipneumoniae]